MLGYQELEDKIFGIFNDNKGECINLPEELKRYLGLSSTRILKIDSDISRNHNSKTDVLVIFEDSKKLKISIKKENADYYGNWYTHQRIEEEFGKPALEKLVKKTTEWANDWIKQENSSFFLGHDLSLDTSANILLQTDGNNINSVDEVIENLVLFDEKLLKILFENIKIVFRPINPMTERSNRGKQTYTKFVPHQKFSEKTTITTKKSLKNIGSFKPVDLDEEYKLNHNRLIFDLDKTYNLKINAKE